MTSGDTAGIVAAAMSQIGVPYLWGGESSGKGFDCSGLTQWAYSQAGVTLPRTSEAQYAATTTISQAQAQPGDLVFSEFGAQGQSGPGHVGIYLGGGKYLDAPFTGANVRVDSVPAGAVFGQAPASHDVTGAVTPGSSSGPGLFGQILNDATFGLYGQTAGAVTASASLIGDILHPSQLLAFWQRLGMGALGVAFFVVGLAVYFASTDTGQKTATAGTTALASGAL